MEMELSKRRGSPRVDFGFNESVELCQGLPRADHGFEKPLEKRDSPRVDFGFD